MQQRWGELPEHKQTQFEVCLLVLMFEIGNVVTDFVPSDHATRILHFPAAFAALHPVMSSWDDGGDGRRW